MKTVLETMESVCPTTGTTLVAQAISLDDIVGLMNLSKKLNPLITIVYLLPKK